MTHPCNFTHAGLWVQRRHEKEIQQKVEWQTTIGNLSFSVHAPLIYLFTGDIGIFE